MINAFHDILTISNPDHDPIIISSDLILFNHPPPGMNQLHARDLIDTIMLAKHVIVKLKYRHNPERIPTERLFIATVALDAEKKKKSPGPHRTANQHTCRTDSKIQVHCWVLN